MSKIATAAGGTVWECDRCERLEKTPNAFTLPNGWWQATIVRLTDAGKRRGPGVIDACSKQCLTEAITFQNQELVP